MLTKPDEEMTEWDNFIYEKIHPFTAHPFAQDACSSSEIGHPGDKLQQKEKRKKESKWFLKGQGKSCLSVSGEWEGLSLRDSNSCHLIPECNRWTSTSQQLSLCPSTVTGHQRCNPMFNMKGNWISLGCSLIFIMICYVYASLQSMASLIQPYPSLIHHDVGGPIAPAPLNRSIHTNTFYRY